MSLREFAEKYLLIKDINGRTRHFNEIELIEMDEFDRHIKNNEKAILVRTRKGSIIRWI